MSPPSKRVVKFIVIKTKPRIEDFSSYPDRTIYILVQPKDSEPSTALYFLDNKSSYLKLIATENIDSMLTEAIPTVTNYDYTNVTKLNSKQEKKIESLMHFSVDSLWKEARREEQLKALVEQRTSNGISATNIGQPIRMNEPACLVLHCNLFNDGYGDIGNAIDVTRHILEYSKPRSDINFYFVLTATMRLRPKENVLTELKLTEFFITEITNLFKKYPGTSFEVNRNIFIFQRHEYINFDGLIDSDYNFNLLINNNAHLKKVYELADAIINIATPFPALPESIQLKPDTQIINITEHNAVSLWFETSSLPEVHHYVTGVRTDTSGLMIEDLSCDQKQSANVLTAITDKEYIRKLGLTYPVSTIEAIKFLEQTLVVPVYLGEMQQANLASLIYLMAQSPLGSNFSKIIFHINQRSYNPALYKEKFDELERNHGACRGTIELIIGHFFKEDEDLRRLYQLSSGVGVAIISSDKVLELAISCGLMPIYPPVPWKTSVFKDLCELGKENQDYSALHEFLKHIDTIEFTNSSFINTNLIDYWAKVHRPELLDKSFYGILQSKILGKNILGAQETRSLYVSSGMLFQQPLQPISNQVFKLFAIQISDLHITSNKILQFSIPQIRDEHLVEILSKSNAELFYLNDKQFIKIQGSQNIEQFLVGLGFKGSMLKNICSDLAIETTKPDEGCTLM